MGALSRSHAEIEHHVAALHRLLGEEQVDAETITDLRSYPLRAVWRVLRLHNAMEERARLPCSMTDPRVPDGTPRFAYSPRPERPALALVTTIELVPITARIRASGAESAPECHRRGPLRASRSSCVRTTTRGALPGSRPVSRPSTAAPTR